MRAQLWSLRRRTRSSLPLCTPIRGRYWTRCRVPIRVAFETASLLAKYQASFHRRPAAAFMGDAPMRCRNAAWTSQSYVRRRRGVSLPAISTDLPERSLALSDKAPTMTDTELLFMSATRAAALIRRKKLSPVEYVDAALSAAERLQPKLNCFMTITGDQAREAAKAAERAVMTGERLGALHGIPVGVKDLLPTKGVRTTFGSVAFADHVPDRDDVLVTRLRTAGAIMIGKTTTPEFGIKGQTDGPIFGVTRNPWNPERTPGGSSGGAAASVAAGIGPVGLGRGGGGAAPLPAARAVMHAALGGDDSMDPWTANAAPIGKLAPALLSQDLSGVRIGYLSRSAAPKIAEDVLKGVRASLDVLAGLGAEVEEVNADIDWMSEHQRALYLSSIANNLGSVVERFGDKTDRVLRAYVAAGKKYDIAAYIAAINARTRLFRAIQGLFETYDFLVSPTVTRPALDADFDGAASIVEVDGEPVGPTQPAFTGFVYPFNLTGHPALAVPSGWGADGLPTSVQIIGPRHGDSGVLRLGALLEQARPWADRTPGLVSH